MLLLSPVILLASGAAAGDDSPPPREFLPVDGASDADGAQAHAWTPDGSQVLVAHEATGEVTFLDPDLRARVAVGAGPLDIEVSPVNGLAVVANSLDDSVTVIDIASATALATVSLSGSFPYRVEVAASGAFAAVACSESDSVSVVDLQTLRESHGFSTLAQSAVVPALPFAGSLFANRAVAPAMDLGPDEVTLAVPGETGVGVYDVTTGALLAQSTLLLNPAAVAVGPSGRYVAIHETDYFGTGMPHVLDVQTGTTTRVHTCPYYYDCITGMTPESLAVSPTREVALFAGDGRLIFVDLEAAESLADLDAGGGTLALSPDGRLAFTSGYYGLALFDVEQMRLLADLPGAQMLDQLVVHPSGTRVSGLGKVAAECVEWYDFDGQGLVQVGEAPTGAPPEGDGPNMVASDAQGERLVTANYRSRTATILEPGSGARHVVPLEGSPWIVGTDPAGSVAALAYQADDRVAILDLERRELVAHIDARGVRQLAVSADGQRAYLAGSFYQAQDSRSELSVIKLAGADTRQIATLRIPGYWGRATRRLPVSRDDVIAIPRRHSDDALTLVDGGNASILAEIPIPGARDAAFAPDGRLAFVASGSGLWRVRVDGANSFRDGNVAISYTDQVLVSSSGRFVYVTTRYVNPVRLFVVDTESLEILSELTLASTASQLAQAGGDVFVCTSLDGAIQRVRVDPAGLASFLEPIAGSSRPLDLHSGPGSTLFAVPGLQDGLEVFDFSTDERRYSVRRAGGASRRSPAASPPR